MAYVHCALRKLQDGKTQNARGFSIHYLKLFFSTNTFCVLCSTLCAPIKHWVNALGNEPNYRAGCAPASQCGKLQC